VIIRDTLVNTENPIEIMQRKLARSRRGVSDELRTPDKDERAELAVRADGTGSFFVANMLLYPVENSRLSANADAFCS